ncbi:conserved exported hypothetical protein [Tenacibaculum sp. 190524A02b]|uniref:T9SS type A sorting domain-containing protein n=1 Tax=Tenacibaculum vairaonense TaxID=3137860 RepID=A0ABM9PR67_9FLAO
MKKHYVFLLFLFASYLMNAQIVNIPDASFKSALINHHDTIDTNGDGEIQVSEAENFTGNLGAGEGDIEDLTGLEAFINITSLSITKNKITNLDLSKNTKLKTVHAYDNLLETVNFSNNTALIRINLNNNKITNIDLSNNTLLEEVFLSKNLLTVITVIPSNVKQLFLNENKITSFDASQLSSLTHLSLENNTLSNSINVANGNNTNLHTLFLKNNPNLFCIQLDNGFVAPTSFYWQKDYKTAYSDNCSNDNIVNIPDANFKTYLVNNTSININGDSEIQVYEANNYRSSISIEDKNITDLTGIEAFINLKDLFCSKNKLTSLDLSQNINLSRLHCINNQLNELDITNNTKLKELFCYGNKYTSIDISNNSLLQKLICGSSELFTSIDISNNTALKEFSCQNSNVSALDLSKNVNLTRVAISNNPITSIDVTSNTVLKELSFSNTNIANLNLSNNKELTELYCQQTKLTSLDLSANTKLEKVWCSYNALNNLNINGLVNLNELFCHVNKLTSIDISSNINLSKLDCSSNLLSSLNITSNALLTSIDVRGNSLTELNLANGNNTNLTPLTNLNSNLTCITVDDVNYSKTNWTHIDTHTSFSLDCSNVYTLTINNDNGDVTMTPTPENSNNTNYDNGTKVTLTATPKTGYQFDGWTGDATGNTNPLIITMDADKNITANYSKIQHALTTSATNGTIITNPNATNGTYDYGTNVELTATPETGYQFDGWSGDATGNSNPLTITINTDKNITANFSKIQTTLSSVINNENGSLTISPEPVNGYYEYGTEVTITAVPKSGYEFDSWSGDATGNSNPIVIIMNTSKVIGVSFSKIKHTLVTNAINGTITTDPNPTNGKYEYGTVVTLTATPETGYQFDGWSGDATGNSSPVSITINGDKNITANFSKIQTTLSVTNIENGSLTISPDPVNGNYEYGTEVTITAVPNNGYEFDSWSGDASGNTNPIVITMDASKVIGVNFTKTVTPITITEFATGFTSLEGIGINSNNEVYVSEHDSGKIYKIASNGTKTQFASTGFRANDIVFDTNNKLFIAEPYRGKILEANATGTLSEYVDAFGDSPYGVIFNNGSLYYVSENNQKVIKINSDKTKTDVIDGFFTPESATFDKDGNMYVTDRNDRKLFKVTPSGTKTTLVSGYAAIRGVVVVNDAVYFTTYAWNYNKIVKYDLKTAETSDYVITNLDEPRNLEVDKLGNMYITNGGNGTVTKVYDENLKPSDATNNIIDVLFNKEVHIYPNPVNNMISITSKDIDISNNTIYNALGKVVLTSNLSKIDVTKLPSGIYTLKIKGTNNQIAVKKFIKN